MSKSRSGAPRRVAAGLLAGSLAVLGLAFAPPAGATADATVDRVAGATRYGTAAAVATEAYASGSDCVLIATGENFADALAASGLAGADGCPILLVQQDSIPEETSAAIDDLGATTATIVGGTAAVSQNVEDSLANDLGLTVDRVAGATRYETAGDVADAIGDTSGTVIIASGEVAADALSAGPIAANLGVPILLVTTDDIPSATMDRLGDATDVIIAGGTARISDDNQTAIEDASNDADGADRLAGTNRQETSVEVANYEVDTLGWAPTRALLAAPSAPNDDFSPDALVAGPLGGLNEAPILIVTDADNLGPADGFLDDHSDTITEVDLIGGTAVLSDAIATDAETAVQTTDNDTSSDVNKTDAPELTDVAVLNLTSTGGGATVGQLLTEWTFDEEVNSTPIIQAGFKIWDPYGGFDTSESAQINADDHTKVDVVFDVFVAPGDPNTLLEGTVTTVVAGTVQDADGKVNPEGELPGSFGHDFAGGITRNPDLTSVVATSGNTTGTSYDFTFDFAMQVLAPTNFRIVDSNGDVRSSTAATVATDSATANTVVRATFAAPSGTPVGNTGVRGIALNGAVRATFSASYQNPTQSADISAGGQSDSPDLVSVTINDAADQVTFTFDETLDSPVVRTGFHVYYRNANPGTNFATSTASTDLSSTDARTVVAQFAPGAINELVAGAYVDDSAVDRAGVAVKPNRVDEEGVGSNYAGGDYLGPELLSATAADTTNVFGNVTGRKVTFVWDQPVTLTSATSFFVTDSDGNRTNLTGCTLGASTSSTPNNSTVTCATAAVTGTQFVEIGDAELATVASGAVTATAVRNTGNGALTISNHEERSAAPGTARNVASA